MIKLQILHAFTIIPPLWYSEYDLNVRGVRSCVRITRSGDVCPVHVQTVSTSLMSILVNFTRLIFRRFLSPIIQEILFLIVWFAMDVVWAFKIKIQRSERNRGLVQPQGTSTQTCKIGKIKSNSHSQAPILTRSADFGFSKS